MQVLAMGSTCYTRREQKCIDRYNTCTVCNAWEITQLVMSSMFAVVYTRVNIQRSLPIIPKNVAILVS